jgi:hypothetical protein
MGSYAKISHPNQEDDLHDVYSRAPGSFRSVLYPVTLDRGPESEGESGLSADALAERRRRRANIIAMSAPQPLVPRWSVPARIGIVLSSTILLWTLCILLVRMVIG